MFPSKKGLLALLLSCLLFCAALSGCAGQAAPEPGGEAPAAGAFRLADIKRLVRRNP